MHPGSYPQGMDIQLYPDLEAKLAILAEQQGRDRAGLVVEAIERFVDYDAWFLAEVDKGLAEVESGETLSHEEVGAQLQRYLSETPSKG
jgi:predicted transcriptional regulator